MRFSKGSIWRSRGHRVALVGSNGAGKTTLIRCLLGEYKCQGEVRVDGLDPRDHRRKVPSKIGFVPQLPPPLRMPVGQLISFAAGVCAAEPLRMEEVADRLGLDLARFRSQPFARADDAFGRAILAWGFRTSDGGRTWEGVVPGPDRLRFLGMLSRYAALLASIGLDEVPGLVPVEVSYA